MSEELDSAVSSLGEQTKKLNIALYYVNGDMQKAKQMVAGTYKDLYALKCNFTSSSLYGAFLIHYNHMSFKITNIYVAVGPSYAVQSIEAGDDWRTFEKAIHSYIESGEQDDILSRTLRDKLTNSFSFLFIGDLNKYLKANNDISLNRMFQKVIQDSLGLQRVEANMMYQAITSLEMELFSISARKLDQQLIDSQKSKEEQAVQPAQPEKPVSSEPKVGQDGVKLIIHCGLILSPIKGKDISKLLPGDRVKVNIVDNNPKAVTVAEAFDAYKDNKFLPIIGRIKSIQQVPGSGYLIYAVIAKGIIAKIIEEEDNIRVAMDPAYSVTATEEAEAKSNLPIIMIVMTAIAIAIGVIIVLLNLL